MAKWLFTVTKSKTFHKYKCRSAKKISLLHSRCNTSTYMLFITMKLIIYTCYHKLPKVIPSRLALTHWQLCKKINSLSFWNNFTDLKLCLNMQWCFSPNFPFLQFPLSFDCSAWKIQKFLWRLKTNMKQIYDELMLPAELHYFQCIALFVGYSLYLLGNIFDMSKYELKYIWCCWPTVKV